MKTFSFSIPDRSSSIFRCKVIEDGIVRYTREVHVYNSSFSEEMNTIIIAKKMAQTLDMEEKELIEPVRLAIVLGEYTYNPTELK